MKIQTRKHVKFSDFCQFRDYRGPLYSGENRCYMRMLLPLLKTRKNPTKCAIVCRGTVKLAPLIFLLPFSKRSELNAAAVFFKENVTGRPSHTAQNLRARPENNRTNLLGHGPEAPRLRGPCARARVSINRFIGKCDFFYGNMQNDQGKSCSVC